MQKQIDEQGQVKVTANASCRKCYGRGIIGTNIKTGKKFICSCVVVISPPKKKV